MAGAEDKDMEWILRNEEIDWTLINSPEGLGGKNSLELSPMQVVFFFFCIIHYL